MKAGLACGNKNPASHRPTAPGAILLASYRMNPDAPDHNAIPHGLQDKPAPASSQAERPQHAPDITPTLKPPCHSAWSHPRSAPSRAVRRTPSVPRWPLRGRSRKRFWLCLESLRGCFGLQVGRWRNNTGPASLGNSGARHRRHLQFSVSRSDAPVCHGVVLRVTSTTRGKSLAESVGLLRRQSQPWGKFQLERRARGKY